MAHLALMIADSNDDFAAAIENELCSSYITHHVRNGKDALKAAFDFKPDIIVLDLMLTEIDGITLLHSLRNNGFRPMVLALTPLFTDYVYECAEELGIQYVMRKPCEATAVAERVRDLSKRLHPKPAECTDPSEILSGLLRQLGISPRHKGFEYLREAAYMMYRNPGISLTKELYPAVGEKYASTSIQVERSIRSALNVAWNQERGNGWADFSPAGSNGIAQRPSNGYLIARLAEVLNHKLANT